MTLSLKLTEVEQEFSMGDKIPTVNEYWACRMTTSGVRPFLALAEYG